MQDLISWLDAAGRAPLVPAPAGDAVVARTTVPPALDDALRHADRDMMWCMIMCPDDGEDGGDSPDTLPDEAPDGDDDGQDADAGRRDGA